MSNDTNHIIDAYVLGAACWFEDREKGFVTGEVTKVQIKGEHVQLAFKDERGRVSPVSIHWRVQRDSMHL